MSLEKKQQLIELLKLHYGYESFRPGQEKVIDNILTGRSTVVIMPTGGGKSLCYQLPALVLDGATLVISPLISLMKDQVDGLKRIGIPATFINSTVSAQDTVQRLQDVKDGKYKLLYIAPERFYNSDFIKALDDIKVSLFAIDEAHCISQWGHDFRPSYLKLKYAIERLGKPIVLALTATATPEVRADIIVQSGLDAPELVITGFARPNLQFGAIQAVETRKHQLVLDALSTFPDKSGIIYIGTRARADNLLQILLENGIEAVSYHAGMEADDRKWVQENFMAGKAKVIVATNAFGLGIDKPDIRFVIHYDMPGTVEAYYQESGRAGRDGKPSLCLMLYNSRDRHLQEFFIKGDNPPPEIILQVYELLLNYGTDIVLITYSEILESLGEMLPEMAVGTSLKILEREGYISRTHEKSGQAFLKLLKNYEYINDLFGPRAKKQKELFDIIYSRFSNELTAGWDVNLQEVADILEVKKDGISRLIKNLTEKNLVEYQPPFRGTEIRILKRVSGEDVSIDFKALKEKLKSAYNKLDKIEDYALAPLCRQKYILDYFGEADTKNCGKCDNCLGGNLRREAPLPRYKKTAEKKYNGKKFKEKEFTSAPPKARSVLSTKLTQLETFELANKGLSIDKIAAARGLNKDSVVNHLCYLIEKKLIKNIDNYVDKKKQSAILAVGQKLGAYTMKPIKEELGDGYSYDEIKLTLAQSK